MATPQRSSKVGRVAVAVGLVAFGAALLADNLNPSIEATRFVLRLWPLLLIFLGAEYLIRTFLAQRRSEETKLQFDIGGALLLIVVILLSLGITTVRGLIRNEWGLISLPGAGPSVQVRENLSADASGAEALEIRVPVGSIRLEPNHGSEEILVEATLSAQGLIINRDAVRRQLEQLRLDVSDGRTIRVTMEGPDSLREVNVHLRVQAPPGLKVTAEAGTGFLEVAGYGGDLQLVNGVGRIQVDRAEGSLVASSNTGSISVSAFDGPVTARTEVGSLTIANVSGPVQLDSGTGAVSVREFRGGKLSAETRRGSIHALTSSPLQGDVMLRTETGSITLSVPESSVRATAQTRTGSLTVPFFMSVTQSGASRSAVGSHRDGEHSVILETGTGSITFNQR